MLLIECSCGMVMSVSSKGPRASCIRCGGIEFQLLERRDNRATTLRNASYQPLGNGAEVTPLDCIATTLVDSLTSVSLT